MEKDGEETINIQVAIRVRPLLERELSVSEFAIVRVEDNLIVVFDPIDIEFDKQNKQMLEVFHRSREQKYAFDNVFTCESVDRMYDKTVHNLIEPLFRGFNGCVFAYGATGTGKTHTMLGNTQTNGLNFLAVKEIFDRREEMPDQVTDIYVSYVEIYNEQIRDLLSTKDNGICELRDDPLKGVILTGATETRVESLDEVKTLLLSGNKRRTTEATNANLTSSRSHAIFQVRLDCAPRSKDIAMEKTVGKLSMIDLAGSERGTVTENRGLRLREGAKINQSLLALANCINALGDRSKKGAFVPYRDSKLTRMLKDSLGGNCKTVMVVTVSPSSSQFEETLNTLKYANRAKNITTKPVENKKLVEFHIAEYKNIISELKQEIESLRLQIPDAPLFTDCNCRRDREKDQLEAEAIRTQLVENFRERIQLRRGLCELSAQNQLNEMEIREGQEKLLRYTLSRSGKLVAKEALDDGLPRHLKRELSDISQLQISLDYNESQKAVMKEELALKTAQARHIIDSLGSRIKNADQRQYLEAVVKSHILELENDELEYSLHLQEKLNIILVDEIKRLRKICDRNQIIVSDREDDILPEPGPFAKKLTPPSAAMCHEVFEQATLVEKPTFSSAQKKRTSIESLPPISEFFPTLKAEKRVVMARQRSKEGEEWDRAINGSQLLRENRIALNEERRKLKLGRIPKLKTKNSLK